MAYAKELRQQLAPIAVQIQTLQDAAKAEGNRGFTSDERTRFQRLIDDHNSLETSIDLAEKGDSIVAKVNSPDNRGQISDSHIEELRDTRRLTAAEKRDRDRSPSDRAFGKFIRNGIQALDTEERAAFMRVDNSPEFRNAMSTVTGNQGGFLVPQGFSGQLDNAMKWFGGIEPGVVEIFETNTGQPWPWPGINDSANRGRIIGQNVQVVQTDLVIGSQVTFGAYIGSSDLVLVPTALMEDSYFDLEGLVARLLGTRLGRLYNWKCTTGTGSNEPGGIVTEAVAAGAVRQFVTGLTAGISYDELVNIEHLVDPAYRYDPSARWMFSDAVLKLLKKLVDSTGRPLWQPGLTASFRDGAAVDLIAARPTILDHPYVINQDMATPAASAYTILFGALNNFKVRSVAGGTQVMRLVERYADYLQIGFMATRRFDSHLIDSGTHPIGVGQQSAG